MAKKTPFNTAAIRPAAGNTAPKAAAAVVAPSYEQVAARAYGIYRERSRLGKPGNADSDWLAAEAELRKPLGR
jgi:hypothetical protein